MDPSWLLLQLSDSAFPSGGFVHSNGLEAAYQQGQVHNRESLIAFARAWLWQLGCAGLPLMNAAYARPEDLPVLDARAECFHVSPVALRASRTQGRAFLDTCARIFSSVEGLRAQALEAGCHLHHAPVFGAVLRTLGVERRSAQQLFLSLGFRGLFSAAVRLGIVGTHDAQRLLNAFAIEQGKVLSHCEHLPVEALAQTAPVLELLGAAHDRLYSRLFQS